MSRRIVLRNRTVAASSNYATVAYHDCANRHLSQCLRTLCLAQRFFHPQFVRMLFHEPHASGSLFPCFSQIAMKPADHVSKSN